MIKLSKVLVLALFIAALPQANAQTKLVEKVLPNGNDPIIPYEKYLLSNGLTLVIHEDHSDPMVHVNVAYHVGSAREVKNRSGFAHFYEHMLFQGTEHVRDEEHMHIVDAAGGTWNGNTNRDRTKYFETMPSNYLEMGLYLEADRMGFVLDSVTQRKFEVQRSTVKNEKGQRVDNVPYGRFEELKNNTIYPYGHPYSWTTIGYTEDLDRATLEDMKNFFIRWYGPNNACLIVSGDVNPMEVVKLTEKYFGDIGRCPEVKKMKLEAPILAENKYANYPDKVSVPVSLVIYPSVPLYHPDEPALDMLAYVLGAGKNSYLYKNMVKTDNALQASAGNSSEELAGEFTVQLVAYPFTSLDTLEAWLAATYVDFEKNGVNEELLKSAKTGYEIGYIGRMNSVASKADILGDWWLYSNKTMNIKDEIDRYNRVTKEDVVRVYNKYIKGKAAAWINIYPKMSNPDDEEKKETTTTNTAPVTVPDEYKNLVYKKNPDNIDRNKRPVAGVPKTVTIPNVWRDKMDNGIKLIGSVNNETPFVTINLSITGGAQHELKTPDKRGMASLVANMMDEGTKNYAAEKFELEVDKLGAGISVGAGDESMTLSLRCPVKNLDAALKLFEERLMNSKFTEEDFKRIKRNAVQGLENEDYDAGSMADIAFSKLMFGNTIWGTSASTKTVKNVNFSDVTNFYTSYFTPSLTEIMVVGDIRKEDLMPKLGFLKNWAAKAVEVPANGDLFETEKTKIYMVDKYEAPQSEIRMGYMALPFSATGEYYKANVMNFQLGGNFNGRLVQNIREDKGFTYGIGGGFRATKEYGYYEISTAVRSTSTDTAVKEIYKELNNFKNGQITEDDLTFTKNSLLNRTALRFETSGQKMGYLSGLLRYDLPADYLKSQDEVVNNFNLAEMKAYAAKYLPTEKMVILVVGDKASLKKRLENLKIGEVEMISDFRNAPFSSKNRVKWVKKD